MKAAARIAFIRWETYKFRSYFMKNQFAAIARCCSASTRYNNRAARPLLRVALL